MGVFNRQENSTKPPARQPRRPWAAVPAQRSSARSLKVKQRIVIATLLIAASLGPLALFISLSSNEVPPPPPKEDPSWIVSFAETVAVDFLAGRPTDMPTVDGLDPKLGVSYSGDDASRRPALAHKSLTHYYTRAEYVGAQPVDVSTFRVVLNDGKVLDLSVTTISDANGRTLLAAAPSLTPARLAAPGAAKAPLWQGDPNAIDDVPQTVGAATKAWAEAYGADDRPQLRLLVGGGPEGGEYVGLGGFNVSRDPQTLGAYPSPNDPSQLVVRVRVGFSADSANGYQATNDYDLLVANPTSTDARVVAWGAPGTGQTLVPYQNNTAS